MNSIRNTWSGARSLRLDNQILKEAAQGNF